MNKALQSTVAEFCRPDLIDGKLYAFKINGHLCSGIYLAPDDETGDGAFYCNGKAVYQAYEATQIKRMVDARIHSAHMMRRYADEALLREVMFIIQSAVEAAGSKLLRAQDEVVVNLVNAHSTICKRLVQTQGEEHDSIQAPRSHLSASAEPVVVSVSQDEEIKANEHILQNIIIDRVTIPWDVEQSIKSVERRIQAAVKVRDFAKAGRLNNVSVAIRHVHTHCQELLNASH